MKRLEQQVALKPREEGVHHSCRRMKRSETAPLTIDVTDSEFSDPNFWMAENNDLLLKLEELYPGDPGELSGVDLLLTCGVGNEAVLNVNTGMHCLGYLYSFEARAFARQALACFEEPDTRLNAKLRELYPEGSPDRFSGAELRFASGEDGGLSVCFGSHCLGIAGGPALREFLRRVLRRTSVGVDPELDGPRKSRCRNSKVVNIAGDPRRQPAGRS